ncbi:MAG: hypothetical protein ACYDH4_05380 [Candidatus Cryosericum sp.]
MTYEFYQATESRTMPRVYDGVASAVTGARIQIVDDYVENLRNLGMSWTTVTQRVFGIRRYLEYCARKGVHPHDNPYGSLIGFVVDEERHRLEDQAAKNDKKRDEALEVATWRHARETFRLLSQYVTFAVTKSGREAHQKPAWRDVAIALTSIDIYRPARGAEKALIRHKDMTDERWWPTWPEFAKVVASMQDARIRVASLCMFGAQITKEEVVSVLRDDVRCSLSGDAVVLVERGESMAGGRIRLELPQRIMDAVETHLRSYEGDSPWLVPSHDRRRWGAPMSASWIMQKITETAKLQGIGMTCRRIQLAGAVDAIEHGEAKEKVLKRLGGKRWTGELRKALGEKRS